MLAENEPHEHDLPYYLDWSDQTDWKGQNRKRPQRFRRDKIYSAHKKFRPRFRPRSSEDAGLEVQER